MLKEENVYLYRKVQESLSAFSFQKVDRILKRSDFLRLARNGKRIHGKHFVVAFCRNSLGNTRLGITASKRVGCAVARNRIKRLVREYFRSHRAGIDGTYDLNIIAKKGSADLSSKKINQTLEGFFHKISTDSRNEDVTLDTY